ncbi:E3 ubiquitin-protein ligase RNF123 isoform X3 [Bradysia coprophila]|uniref:E3 ubiquitin-protein ligase RNF123 isoform X3 n=1 Tax=Bradysia coprophila TaxID=38358 RepID=UPI00187DD962|nr:E3 ubiquitin-protein ligase RNF123 isoform X3 [Bradysia coprophila]
MKNLMRGIANKSVPSIAASTTTSDIFINVFGELPSVQKTSLIDFKHLTFEHQINELRSWLDTKLAILQENSAKSSTGNVESFRDGFIGTETVVFDVWDDDLKAGVNVSNNGLLIQSQSPFPTVKANCCVYRGKWMYEVQLRSKGIMQIGWCSAKCKFTDDTGIGDTPNSYGLDGSKQRLWNVKTKKFGPFWRSGDVYGVCIDMDNGKIEYYRNGVALGEAFSNIERGPGVALFPAVSLAVNETIVANFGGSPFRHPVPGYNPLQEKPDAFLAQAEFLLQNLVNLSRLMSSTRRTSQPKNDLKQPSNTAVYMIIANLLIEKIAPMLLNSYVMEEKVLSYVQSMCVLRSDTDTNSVIYPGQPNSTLSTFLTLLWTYLNDSAKQFILKFVDFLSSLYRETPADLEYAKQRKVIVILRCLCNHARTRKFLLEFKLFKRNCLPVFLYIKPPDEATLGELLPNEMIWTEGLGGSKEAYLNASDKLIQSTDGLYVLQKSLMETLLQNDDNEGNESASSRKIFVEKFKKYVKENSLEQQGHYVVPTQPAVALSFLCILLDVSRNLFGEEVANQSHCIVPRYFFDGTLRYAHMDRVGGNLSYLRNVYKKELIEALGGDSGHSALVDEPQDRGNHSDMSIYSAMFLITGSSSSNEFMFVDQPNSSNIRQPVQATETSITAGTLDAHQSISEILDSCVIYYYAVAHKYITMIADLRENISVLSDVLTATKSSLEDIKSSIERFHLPVDSNEEDEPDESMDNIIKDLYERFGNRNNVFAKTSMELARKQIWYRSVALGSRRRELLSWMLHSIFQTLNEASALGGLFTFVPEIYVNILPILLDTVMDFSFHDISDQYDQTDNQHILELGSSFLTKHSGDDRIVLATCKDAILQAIGTLICHKAGMTTLEKTDVENQICFVKSLLRPYEERAWGQSNWVLTRFWLGNGFAFRDARPPSLWQGGKQRSPMGLIRSRGKSGLHTGLLHHIAPAYPSEYFHQVIKNVLTKDEELCSVFMNSVLTQLNWAFTEFILFVQEIQKTAREHRVEIEPRQLKVCSMCFELTVSLMRSLEMIITVAPDIFKDPTHPNSELLTIRVVQIINQLLSRVTVPPGSFQYVVDLCLPDLSAVTHFSIITAALGILMALLSDELMDDDNLRVPPISKIILNDESFQIASLEYALGTVRTPIQRSDKIPRGNFDPKTRDNIDPLTNEVKLATNAKSEYEVPIIKFNLNDYMTHVTETEIQSIQTTINLLSKRQSIMSHTTVPSEDSICPICYAKAVSCVFYPCKHQSCSNCILQHLMNNTFCFYCKTLISKVKDFPGAIIYESKNQDATTSSI